MFSALLFAIVKNIIYILKRKIGKTLKKITEECFI